MFKGVGILWTRRDGARLSCSGNLVICHFDPFLVVEWRKTPGISELGLCNHATKNNHAIENGFVKKHMYSRGHPIVLLSTRIFLVDLSGPVVGLSSTCRVKIEFLTIIWEK